ncbi:hypothetical protein [Sphingomonas sp. 3-13AW]|uniref:hypothetical protein n=1 Tax=Sphingomonas sp. 3-13AW TaxID=3050450 RepID=UPI003BB7F089
MTSMTTSQLTATAGKHIVQAVREGLGVNATDAKFIFDTMHHLPFIEKGEDLRGIEARVRKGTSVGTRDACFDLFLNDKWKGAFRTGSVATRRAHFIDEAMELVLRDEITGPPSKVDYTAQHREREAAGRSGEITGTIWACEPHPMDDGCVRIDVLSDEGETYVLAVIPIMNNSAMQTLEFAREKVGKRLRILWVRAPEFCADYEIGSVRTAAMEDEMIADFFLPARFKRPEDIASVAELIEGATLRESLRTAA